MRKIIKCVVCGEMKKHEAKGMCKRCNSARYKKAYSKARKVKEKVRIDAITIQIKAYTSEPGSEECRIRQSCGHLGIDRSEWNGFAKPSPYCDKFNESCRESNRAKYDHKCFICDKSEEENGRRLSVHHVDMNKQQGCDDHEWKLVPLCSVCHGMAHSDLWRSRLMYLIDTFITY